MPTPDFRLQIEDSFMVKGRGTAVIGRLISGDTASGEPVCVQTDDGKTTFTASAQGKHQNLTVDPAQKEKVLQAFVDLASAKPVPPQRFRPPAAADQKKADPADAVVVPKP